MRLKRFHQIEVQSRYFPGGTEENLIDMTVN
jgi:hypothetical protein